MTTKERTFSTCEQAPDESAVASSHAPLPWYRQKPFTWLRTRFLLLGLFLAGLVIAIVVGVVLGIAGRNAARSSRPTAQPWQPRVGATWNYEIDGGLKKPITATYDVWDIDLFENDQSTIASLQARGSSVLCYFSGGSYEEWRPDAANFSTSDMGSDLSGWPGEKWINTSSSTVRKIMLARLDLAVNKSCNGVDPDNMDGYNNQNGLGLTQQDSIDYVHFLAEAAHARNLSIGLKNAGEIVPHVVDIVQYSVNEACAQYDECAIFDPFTRQGKPVFHVEYPKGSGVNNDNSISTNAKTKICDAPGAGNFSTIIKNSNLDNWIEVC